MKQSLFFLFLFPAFAFAQRNTDLDLNLTYPDGQTLAPGDPFSISGIIKNLGPDTVYITDELKIKWWLNNIPIIAQPGNDSFLRYHAQINPGDSFSFSSPPITNILSLSMFQGNCQACGMLFIDSGTTNLTSDPDSSNNYSCVNFFVGTTFLTTISLENSIKIYPNPTTDFINWEADNSINIKQVILYDLNSKVVYKEQVRKNTGQISVDKFSKGIYLLQITDSEKVFSKRIMIE